MNAPTQIDEAAADSGPTESTLPFYLSDYSSGFAKVTNWDPYWRYIGQDDRRPDAVVAYKILTSCLYGLCVKIDFEYHTAIAHMCNVIAYAEYHDMLPAVARQVESLITNLPGIWKATAERPVFYLAIGKKLRSHIIFGNSLRHFVGQGQDFKKLYDEEIFTKAQACVAILPSKDCLESRIKSTQQALKNSTLPECPDYEIFSGRSIGQAVIKTSKSSEDLAEIIFREYVEYGKDETNTPTTTSSYFVRDSLLKAYQENPDDIDISSIFGDKVIKEYALVYNLRIKDGNNKRHIKERLQSLIHGAKKVIQENFYDCENCGCGAAKEDHMVAEYNENLKYHTLMAVDEEMVPWFGKEQWK